MSVDAALTELLAALPWPFEPLSEGVSGYRLLVTTSVGTVNVRIGAGGGFLSLSAPVKGFESSPLKAELAQSALLANAWRCRSKLYARGPRRGLGVAIDVSLAALTPDALAATVMALAEEAETGAADRLRRAGSLRSLADIASLAEAFEPLA